MGAKMPNRHWIRISLTARGKQMNVFISYAGPDRDLAETAAETLKTAGLDVWLDVWNVLPGDNMAAALGTALQEADAMVLLLTPQSVESDMVQSEWSYALGKKSFKGRLVPVYAGAERSSVPWVLREMGIQSVDIADYAHAEDAFREVATHIKRTETTESC